MTIRQLIMAVFGVMSVFSVGLTMLVFSIFSNQQKLVESYDNRYHSYLLADELRQSSDELTRFARTYAITGDPRFKQYYFDVLAIRNGEKPRPEAYERIYWDFMAANDDKPRRDGAAISLDMLMESAGFTPAELKKLYQAEANSNALVTAETVALNAVEGLFPDSDGKFTIVGEPDRMQAAAMLNDPAYHQEKARIMRPLDEFFVMLDNRTRANVEQFSERSDFMLSVLKVMAVALLALSVLLAWLLVRIVLRPLGGEPATMHHIANCISEGNLNIQFDKSARPGSVYRALQTMMSNLRETNHASQRRAWIQQGVVSLSDVLRQEQSMEMLSSSALDVLCRYVDAEVGTLYCWREDALDDGSGVLELSAGFAHQRTEQTVSQFGLGQGIVGQVAQEDQIRVISDIPVGYLQLVSGTVQGAPRTLVLVPFSFRGKLRGVLELGLLSDLPEGGLELLENLREPLGIAFENVTTRTNLSVALKESQTMSEELQAQQEELRVMNDSLRTKSLDLEEQKTALELSQQEIQHKASELEEASRYKSEFLANMSHELRTPLNSLLILARSLAENDKGHLSEDEVESAQVIQDSGKHLLNLINDILDLSKVEAGKMQVNEEVIETDHLITSLNRRFLPMARDKNIAFEIVPEVSMPAQFVSDYVRLEQILTNLIGNAIKFTAQGHVKVHLRRSAGDEGGQFHMAVSDTGIGISADQQQNVFSAFQQADGSTTREFGGTGLGLSISRELAALLGGTIGLESTPGEGSVFTLHLPERAAEGRSDAETDIASTQLSHAQVSPPAEVSTGEPPLRDDRYVLDKERPLFLIIEDDPKFARILYQACHQQGAQALIAGDGEKGVQLAQKYSITGIVLDYMLPGMDGDEVVSRLKGSDATRDIPVHIMSALDNLSDMKARGVSSQLVKPVSKAQIVDVLQQMYGESQLNQARLLVVEDDAAGSLALQRLLRQENVALDFVHTGQGALDAVTKQSYVAVILDLGLPDMTGFEVLRSLSGLSQEVLPPVIVHTGKELTDDEYLELSNYTDKIVIKSARSPERLLSEVRQFFCDTGTRSEPDVPQALASPVKRNGEEPAEGDMSSAPITVDFKGYTTLLVDDDMRNTFALAKVLRKEQMKVHIAPTGTQALELLNKHDDIDLVLMDIMMPEMDGYEAIARIREQACYSALPIIALTANAMSGDREKCLDAGANDYVSKPIDLNDLMNRMQQLI